MSKRITVNYGLRLPDKSGSFGGCTKLLYLNKAFPDSQKSFKILYLVSSCLPPAVDEWVDMAKRNGIKVVWNQNGVAYPAWAGKYTDEINGKLGRNIHKADFVIYQSNFCQEGADKFLGGYNGSCGVVYNSVDTLLFSPKIGRKQNDVLTLLVMGSHHDSYRVLLPLQLVKIMQDRGQKVKLLIGGRLMWDNAKAEVNKLIVDLGIGKNVELLGSFSQDMAPSIYNRADILLHLKYNDTCPTIPIESMACGTPVVGSNSGGMPELVGDAGVLVWVPNGYDKLEVPSADLVIKAIDEIIFCWENFSKMSRKRAVELFDNNLWIKKHQQIFSDIIER